MHGLTPDQIDRLMRARHRLNVSAVIAVVLVAVVVALLVEAGFPVVLGGGLGVLIGLVLLVPYRRVLDDLGISKIDAAAVISAERDRRKGVAPLTPQQRAARDMTWSWVHLALGVVFLVAFCVAAPYFVGSAGETREENAPDDPWFGVSFITAAISLILAPVFLWSARARRRDAKEALVAERSA
jgi:hypothetical protein